MAVAAAGPVAADVVAAVRGVVPVAVVLVAAVLREEDAVVGRRPRSAA